MSNFRQIDKLDWKEVDPIIDLALREDLGRGDITTDALIPDNLFGEAILLAKAKGVLAGGEVAARIFHHLDSELKVDLRIKDGAEVNRGDIIATVSGKVGSILRTERVVLNFIQRLSGIATQTAQYVAKVQGMKVKVADTRKTNPGMRMLDKYAVRVGGGYNHRYNLDDAVLIKDNHLVAARALGMSLKDVVAKARRHVSPETTVEIEVTSEQEAREVAEAGADVIMLDNMSPEEMKQVMASVPHKAEYEASGGINLDTVRKVAESGVDFLSSGALTHSTKSLDISLELVPESIILRS